jgi:type I restriction enzyme S subunit
MDEWREYYLDELYTFSSGLSKPSSEFGFGYPFLTFKNVFNNTFLPRELTELANTTEKERQTCSILKGDVFLTRTSETAEELGMSSVALKD